MLGVLVNIGKKAMKDPEASSISGESFCNNNKINRKVVYQNKLTSGH